MTPTAACKGTSPSSCTIASSQCGTAIAPQCSSTALSYCSAAATPCGASPTSLPLCTAPLLACRPIPLPVCASSLPVCSPAPATPLRFGLCLLFYSLAGTVEYPWSSSSSLTLSIDPSAPVVTAFGTAVRVVEGRGTRTFTNRFGVSFSSTLTVEGLVYINCSTPVDSQGLTATLTSPIQLPGTPPTSLYSSITFFSSSTGVMKGSSSLLDSAGQSFLSDIPGFLNRYIPASNINSLAVNYSACSAPITFTNGLRAPTQPSVSNGGYHVNYSYTISDGLSYIVQAQFTLTTNSAFASQKDQLGNPYQSVINITGSRSYLYLSTGQSMQSQVSFRRREPTSASTPTHSSPPPRACTVWTLLPFSTLTGCTFS